MVVAALAVLGLILGSFDNALVWRLHQQMELQTERPAPQVKRHEHISPTKLSVQELSIFTGRSMCPNCHHQLATKDLIPVISWVLLKGKCRYCSVPISRQYPTIELLVAALFIVSFMWWPEGWQTVGRFDFGIWLICVAAFSALVVYDIRWYLLPDRVVFPLIGLVALKLLTDATLFGGGLHMIYMATLAVACTAGLFYTVYIVSHGNWIGFGDVKLAIVLGLLAGGPTNGLLLVFLASLLGTFAAVPLLLRGRVSARSQIPFGPFLIASTFIVVLFGSRIVSWYADLLQLR